MLRALATVSKGANSFFKNLWCAKIPIIAALSVQY
jgi:hypothetical protein